MYDDQISWPCDDWDEAKLCRISYPLWHPPLPLASLRLLASGQLHEGHFALTRPATRVLRHGDITSEMPAQRLRMRPRAGPQTAVSLVRLFESQPQANA
eukprot:scaffold161784_cov28-Tisochrysis_lutea.AAC.2